jgi:uracil phosphoribosyltransferase
MGLTIVDHPLVADALAALRDETTGPAVFRARTRGLATALVYEAVRDLPTRSTTVTTPLEATEARVLDARVVLVPILRAGLGLLDPAVELLPDAAVGHLGMERDETTHEPRTYYVKLPPLRVAEVLVLDPMLATGGSAAATIAVLKEAGATALRMICVVAAPEGVRRLAREHPDVDVWTAALDRDLDDAAFIRPGLGDFGDRLHATE